jgi:hypothetical protein
VGKRARARGKAEKLQAPEASYGGLVLRGAMSPGTRREYAELRVNTAGSAEDLWHRRLEFLFERLAVRWDLDGVVWEGQKDLLARFRMASGEERDAVRAAMREHLAEWFPELEAP